MGTDYRRPLINDINDKNIYEGNKFKFKYMIDLNRDLDLVGTFFYNDDELRYEIDVFDNDLYTCLSYLSNGTFHSFELFEEN